MANYGINTRARLGRNREEKRCYYCELPETTTHLFIECRFFNEVFLMLKEHVKRISVLYIPREENTIIYLQVISRITSWTQQRQIAYLIGNYLHAIWRFRMFTCVRGDCESNSGCRQMFNECIKYLPYDNG